MSSSSNYWILNGVVISFLYWFILSLSLYLGYQRQKILKQDMHMDSTKKSTNNPILLSIEIPMTILRGALVFQILTACFFFIISRTIIRNEFTGIFALVQNPVYYDFKDSIQYFKGILFGFVEAFVILLVATSGISLNFHKKLLFCIALNLLCSVADFVRLTGNSSIYQGVSIIIIVNDGLVFFLLMNILLKSSRISTMKSAVATLDDKRFKHVYKEYYENFKKFNEEELIDKTETILETYNAYSLLKSIRRTSKVRVQSGRTYFLLIIILLGIIIAKISIQELSTIFTTTKSALTEIDLEKINNEKFMDVYWDYNVFSKPEKTTLRPHLIILLLSGVNYRSLVENSDFQALKNEFVDIKKDGLLLRMESQIPSTPFNNWFSMLTGTKTEIHGIYGNTLKSKIPFYDNIFKRISDKKKYIKAQVFGSEYFKNSLTLTMPTAPVEDYDNSDSDLSGKKKTLKELEEARILSTLNMISKSRSLNESKSFYYLDLKSNISKLSGFLQNITPTSNLHDRIRLEESKQILNKNFKEFQTIFNNKEKLSNIEPEYFFSFIQIESMNDKALKEGLRESFNNDLSSKISIMRRLISEIDNNTILIATSDTGNLKVGGYGGNDQDAKNLPLFFYKKDSKTFETYGKDDSVYEIIDMAPTICALLGVPVPRHNQGKFIEPILKTAIKAKDERKMVFFDLKVQKEVLWSYLEKRILHKGKMLSLNDVIEKSRQTDFKSESIDDYDKEIENLDKTYNDNMYRLKSSNLASSLLWNLIIILLMVLTIFFVVGKFTYADPLSLLDFTKPSISKKQNRKAFIRSQLILFVYYILSFSYFAVVMFGIQHYTVWSSSMIASPDLFMNFFIILIVPIILSCVYIKLPLLMNAKWKNLGIFQCCVKREAPLEKKSHRAKQGETEIGDEEPESNYHSEEEGEGKNPYLPYLSDSVSEKKMLWSRTFYPLDKILFRRDGMAQVYLTRIYFLLSLMIVYSILLVLWSPFRNFYFHMENSTSPIIFYELWNQRFRILTVSLITLPIFVSAIYALFVWPSWSISHNNFDSIYLLKEYKAARQSARGDRYRSPELDLFRSPIARVEVTLATLSQSKNGYQNLPSHFEKKFSSYNSGPTGNKEKDIQIKLKQPVRETLLKSEFEQGQAARSPQKGMTGSRPGELGDGDGDSDGKKGNYINLDDSLQKLGVDGFLDLDANIADSQIRKNKDD